MNDDIIPKIFCDTEGSPFAFKSVQIFKPSTRTVVTEFYGTLTGIPDLYYTQPSKLAPLDPHWLDV